MLPGSEHWELLRISPRESLIGMHVRGSLGNLFGKPVYTGYMKESMPKLLRLLRRRQVLDGFNYNCASTAVALIQFGFRRINRLLASA